MPLARYFLLAGGSLFLLLLIAGACLPSPPVVERAEARRATIRIHSEMKLPERVVFDTSAPTVTYPVEAVIAVPGKPAPPSAEDISAEARQAFALLKSPDTIKAKVAESKRPQSGLSPSRKTEARKRATTPRKIRLARQPQFDWLGGRMWW
jgi:hypothetical protein